MKGGGGSKMNLRAAGVFADFFFMLSLNYSRGAAERGEMGRDGRKTERRIEGNRQTDRRDGVTGGQGVRRRGREMRETEWGLRLPYVRVSLRDEAAQNQPISTVLTHAN